MAVEPSHRISDSERDIFVTQLRDALSVGRLDLETFHERLDAIYDATTYGEVEAVTSDLPVVKRPREPRRSRLRRLRGTYLSVNLLCWSIWGVQLATGGSIHDLWPLWVTVPWGVWILS